MVRLVDTLGADDVALKQWFTQQLSDMKGLPSALADADPTSFDFEAIRSCLADAEATVLAQLAEIVADGATG